MPSSTNLQTVSNLHFSSIWELDNEIWQDPVVVSTGTTLSIPSVANGGPYINYVKGLTVEKTSVLTTSTYCKGLIYFINGDCLINGTISMEKRGARGIQGDNIGIDYKHASIAIAPTNILDYEYYIKNISAWTAWTVATSTSSAGVARTGVAGASGTYGCAGGGGAGGAHSTYSCVATGGRGAPGTSYGGGSGGGGSSTSSIGAIGQVNPGAAYGGNGGNGAITSNSATRGAGGGAGGNNGGVKSTYGSIVAYNGTVGAGGMLTLIIKGNLTISSTGLIYANGSSGGSIAAGTYSGYGACGGGSGGGGVTILYTGEYTNLGSIRAYGGAGGSGGSGNGGAGGAGHIRVIKVNI